MLAKRLFQKAAALHHHHHPPPPHNAGSCLTPEDVDFRINVHHGIPSTASILAFDPIQNLLAVGTLDGRIKLIGGDNIEGLLISPEQHAYKYLEFIHNEGSLISITIDNSIQVWNLKSRCLACSLCWESNITAFSIISSSNLMYVGDEYGVISVVKYDAENAELLHLPYHIPSEAVGFSVPFHQPVVGVLPQPCSSGTRVLIAYQTGLIILWDVLEAQIVIVRGNKVLWLKNEVYNPSNGDLGLPHDASHELEEKEITALCWASCDGSILAVGYIDGDILFWKTSTSVPGKGQQSGLSEQVVKLQLSSAENRLPVIVLHWWANYKSHRDSDGQLLIYGGDEIGSEEVLTVLSVEWSSGMGTIQCLSRVDLSLSGPFADVVITAGTLRSAKTASLFVLTNPGHLQIFEVADSSASESQQEKKLSVSAVDIPPVVPTINPLITVANLFCLPIDEDSSKALAEIFRIRKSSSTKKLSGGTSFPLTGGVCTHLSSDKDYRIWRVYVAGYHDGSVRIWDATYPVLSSLCVLQNEIRGTNAAISIASVSKLEFCIHTLRLAVGDECGLVRIYDLHSSKETHFHFVTETKNEVEQLAQEEGPICRAAFNIIDSQVQALKFTNSGAKLAAGYECGRIAVLDMNSFSTLFLADTVSCPISMMSVICDIVIHQVGSSYRSGSNANDQTKNLMVILTKDGAVYTIDADNGHLISSRPMRLSKDRTAVSMHVIESCSRESSTSFGMKKEHACKDEMVTNEPTQDISTNRNDKSETENQSSDNKSSQHLEDLLVLLCCKDMLHLCTAKHIVRGDKKPIYKVKLTKPCCWTTIFVKDDRVCGLILLYQTGEIEIRSIPNLELVKETSLASLLRWNFKANMEKTMSSTETGHLTLVNGSELVFLSILLSENDYRIPDSLPSLHDEVLAAATRAAITYSLKHKKKPGGGPRILSGIVKGFKREKLNQAMELACITEPCSSHLEDVFVRNLTPDPSAMSKDYQDAAELNIDDIEIDEPVHLAPTSSHEVQYDNREGRKDREKLFNEDSSDMKPRLRTREEILATYRKAGDASSVAGQARNKLLERQEKLQRISKQTEDLRNGAEDFASLANELVKVMENRKWWQI
ncbi:uncharacterized protein LOC113775402 isoform X3 [Coffea eugenioides]|uniref:uncharacterized protein LOC113775402 isoform X3 n=1 Tax=Coffea eugenioides TaxID=49369 RepID=UPI000F60B482|nr:uncharacterized protein LOC113775402 isoform X3 [Coffea eugenioides]